MKAFEILKCAVYRGIGEGCGMVHVPSVTDEFTPQDERWWLDYFGAMPPKPLDEGEYLYLYTIGTSSDDWLYDGNVHYEPDAYIELGRNDYGETDWILLYRIDDAD